MSPDINLMDLLSEPVEVSGSANSAEFFAPPIPEDGDWTAVLHLGDRGIKVERQRDASGNKTGAAYLNVHSQAKILNDQGEESLSAFDTLTSIVMQSAGTSRLHAVLDLAGDSAPTRCTLGELKEHVEKFFAQGPRVGITTQWEAQIEDESKPKGSRERYRTIAKGMRKFPPMLDEDGQPTGKFNPEIQDPKTGQKVRAQVRIVKYFKP